MSLQLYINSVDKSSLVIWPSLTWVQAQTYEVDTLSFQIQKRGTQTYAPAMLDEVTFYDQGTKVFGGSIVSIDTQIAGVDCIIHTIKCKDYSHLMDRRLVIERYTNTPALNIICDILNKYCNKGDSLEIATFEATEIWSGGTADTTNYRVGTQGLKLTSTGTNVTAARAIIVNLTPTGFDNTTDYIEIDVWVDNIAKLQAALLKLGDSTLTNYYSKDITSLLATGANYLRILKSAFSSTGSPAWTTISKIQVETDATGSDTVNVTFDNWRCVKASAFTRTNAMTGKGITVNFISFAYEYPSKCIQQLADLFQWQWYVDQNKDIHYFAQFTEAAAFNLTDTNGNYVFKSLRLNNNTDQLRNSIYVRGGDYLATTVTENLSDQVDGNNKVFKLAYKYANYSLAVGGVNKSVGVNNLDSYADNAGVSQIKSGVADLSMGDASGNTKQSMQVLVTKVGRRSKVTLRVKKVGAPADNFQIQIFSDDGSNKPSATNLSTVVTLAGASITTSYVEYTFTLTEASANLLLFAVGGKYHIVATRSGANDASNYYKIDTTNAGDYDGISYSGDATPTWTITAYDWYFTELIVYEVLFDFNEKVAIFNTAPAGGSSVTWTGDPYLPVIIQYKDNVSIASYGEYQFKIIDKSILTKNGARQRAVAEILTWAYQVSEGSYKTYTAGLKVGTSQNIQSTIRGTTDDFIIQQVQAKARTNGTLEYTVTVVTTKTLGILYWLQKQIEKDDKTTTVDDNELSDKIEGLFENYAFSDSVAAHLYVGKVWSNDAGTTPNRLQWNGGSLDVWV